MMNYNDEIQGTDLKKKNVIICSRCIYDSSLSGIEFNKDNICNYCEMIEYLKSEYGTGTNRGAHFLEKELIKIKRSGKNKKYDVVIGVSGGTDSSYLLYWSKMKGLRVLAAHYDNTFNTTIATQNIRKITQKLNIDLYTHVCDNKESEDIFKAFFLASVPEIDGPTDIALAEVMFRAASKYNIKYVFEGHSFIAEGVSPLGKAYVDGKYIETVHKKFGKLPMKTFPNMTLLKFLYWSIFKRIKKIRPFWYIDYSKEKAKKILADKFDWTDYGGHHLENRMTAFHHSYYNPIKFNLDQRNNTLAARVRSGSLSREKALYEYAKPPFLEKNLKVYIQKRFQLSDNEFKKILDLPKKYFYNYKTYKKFFELLKPLFYLLAKLNFVPMSFYLKYCIPYQVKKK